MQLWAVGGPRPWMQRPSSEKMDMKVRLKNHYFPKHLSLLNFKGKEIEKKFQPFDSENNSNSNSCYIWVYKCILYISKWIMLRLFDDKM